MNLNLRLYRGVEDLQVYRTHGRTVGDPIEIDGITRMSADSIEIECPLTSDGHIQELESPLLMIVAGKQFTVSFTGCTRFPVTFIGGADILRESFVLTGVKVS